MSRSDDYVRVKAILAGQTRDAVFLVRVGNDVNSPAFAIPKSLIHVADLSKFGDRRNVTEVVEFRLREWKAEDLDL